MTSKQRTNRILVFSGFALASVIIVLAIYESLLVPFFIAAFFAYLLLPLADLVEKRLKIDRSYAALSVMLLMVGFISLCVVGLVPIIKFQVLAIGKMLPTARTYFLESWLPVIRDWLVTAGITDYSDFNRIITKFDLSSKISDPAISAIEHVWSRSFGVLGGVVHGAIIPLICFFLLRDSHTISGWVYEMFPPDLIEGAVQLKRKIDRILRLILKGQVTVAAVLGVLYILGFSIVGLPYAVAIGAIAGICRVVPYLDVFVSVLLCILVIISDPVSFTWGVPIGAAVVIAVVQTLDGMIITPRVIGEKVGLHAGIVIASILAFGSWLGFWGILLAIPIVAVIKVLLEASIEMYKSSAFYRQP